MRNRSLNVLDGAQNCFLNSARRGCDRQQKGKRLPETRTPAPPSRPTSHWYGKSEENHSLHCLQKENFHHSIVSLSSFPHGPISPGNDLAHTIFVLAMGSWMLAFMGQLGIWQEPGSHCSPLRLQSAAGGQAPPSLPAPKYLCAALRPFGPSWEDTLWVLPRPIPIKGASCPARAQDVKPWCTPCQRLHLTQLGHLPAEEALLPSNPGTFRCDLYSLSNKVKHCHI
ncbi:uncharacterized protein LOC101712748 isoform X2 [Heterocephalus glaber]|uniref:Uncharacterized protein LOC101712748 isoform X2 n=1 Tax=Heterocephalus glaber TaxID=10181 RepID=A0AAX6TJ54_HETGA|nr:uncharacterized protein LOC101712748 isoform X2 [Heterocephalus glaber]